MTRFEIFRRNNGRYYYRVIADSGHNILSSDGFGNKDECKQAVDEVKLKITNKGKISIRRSSDELWKFIISGKANTAIGYSMDFNSEKQCDNWIRLMQNYLPDSNILDLTTT